VQPLRYGGGTARVWPLQLSQQRRLVIPLNVLVLGHHP
jgi:hypothetical protein